MTANQSNPKKAPDADLDARIAYEAIERLAIEQRLSEANSPELDMKRSLLRGGSGAARGLLVGSVLVILARQFSPAHAGVSGVPYSFIAGAVVCIGLVVWTVIRVRREFRERREAIRAKRAGLCTCNYPRPPGMIKCPECGGAMVMK